MTKVSLLLLKTIKMSLIEREITFELFNLIRGYLLVLCENLNPFDKLIDSNKQLIRDIDAFEELITCLILVLNNVLTRIRED